MNLAVFPCHSSAPSHIPHFSMRFHNTQLHVEWEELGEQLQRGENVRTAFPSCYKSENASARPRGSQNATRPVYHFLTLPLVYFGYPRSPTSRQSSKLPTCPQGSPPKAIGHCDTDTPFWDDTRNKWVDVTPGVFAKLDFQAIKAFVMNQNVLLQKMFF